MSAHAVSPYVLVGVDGSPSALRAVCWAAGEAQRRAIPLVIAHVVDTGMMTYDPYVQSVFADEITQIGTDMFAAAEQRVEKHFPSVPTSTVTRAGDPAGELITLSEHAVLTVVGASGRGGFTATLLGSVAMALITHGRSPVSVVRAPHNAAVPQTGPVIVGVDGSDSSEEAIAWAFDEASRRRASLIAVHSWMFYATTTSPFPTSLSNARARSAQSAQEHELIAERLAGWQEKYPDVHVQRVTEMGRPADDLLDMARHAQLVVIGCRGHGEMTGVWFDSVTRTLIHRAECPVLVARNPKA